MEPIGGQSFKLSNSSSRFSSSGQKCERALAFKIEDVRPWGVEQKFSAAFADVSTLHELPYSLAMAPGVGMLLSATHLESTANMNVLML